MKKKSNEVNLRNLFYLRRMIFDSKNRMKDQSIKINLLLKNKK
jgi:hypothetical protein